MVVYDSNVFPGLPTPVLTQLFFPFSHRLLFSHASAEVRGENTPERKFASNGDQTHNHQVMSQTRSPLSMDTWMGHGYKSFFVQKKKLFTVFLEFTLKTD